MKVCCKSPQSIFVSRILYLDDDNLPCHMHTLLSMQTPFLGMRRLFALHQYLSENSMDQAVAIEPETLPRKHIYGSKLRRQSNTDLQGLLVCSTVPAGLNNTLAQPGILAAR